MKSLIVWSLQVFNVSVSAKGHQHTANNLFPCDLEIFKVMLCDVDVEIFCLDDHTVEKALVYTLYILPTF